MEHEILKIVLDTNEHLKDNWVIVGYPFRNSSNCQSLKLC